MKNKLKAAALAYHDKGFSVIPLRPREKIPLYPGWQKYCTALATREEVEMWWTKNPTANIGIACGPANGRFLFVVDQDVLKDDNKKPIMNENGDFKQRGDITGCPATVTQTSGSGGKQLFYWAQDGYAVKNYVGIRPLIDIRGINGQVVVPPSIHPNGKEYKWDLGEIDPSEITEFPRADLDALLGKKESTLKKWEQAINGVGQGSRNDTAASMAGKILHDLKPALWQTIGWEGFRSWNKNNNPPLSDSELLKTWDSIKKYHGEKAGGTESEKDLNQADKIVLIVKNNPSIVLFHTDLDEAFILFPVEGHKEYWPCKSKKVKLWLVREYWNRYKTAPNSDAINTALNIIEGGAIFEGKKYELSNRVAYHNGDIIYCLTNENWEAVRISRQGWKLEKDPPILFRRYSHQQSQITPDGKTDLWGLFKYVNIKREDHKLLLLVWLIACFIPDFPHPILYFHGPQGSAKTTAAKIFRGLIDPSKIEVADFPKDTKELVQMLSHHWCLIFDNVTHISHELSDLLCRAVSGAGFSKRELYSDDSDIIYSFRRCIGINGINLPPLKPDLLERSILLELERVSQTERKQEQDMLQEFERELPSFLGAIFTTLSEALSIRNTVRASDLPRMADFTLWGCAIAEALGLNKSQFLKAYTENINLQHDEVINSNIEASFILDFMADKKEWVGSPTDLFHRMTEAFSDDRRIWLPKSPSALSRRLIELKTNLEEAGVIVDRIGGQQRQIILRKQQKNAAYVELPPSSEGTPEKSSANSWFENLSDI